MRSKSVEPGAEGVGRRRVLVWIVAGAVLMSIGGLISATWIKSPQQLAAEAGPPKASPISAAVERRVLRETVILRGQVAPGRSVEVTPVAGEESAAKLVVSAPPLKVGTRVRAGNLVSVISGRPMFALQGKVPAYRDLRAGMKGKDVEQIQAALRNAGYSLVDSPGKFGEGTQAAVRRLYVDHGFDPVTEQAPAADAAPSGADPRSTPAPDRKPRKTVVLPAGEVVMVGDLPARVIEVKALLGAEVEGPVLTLATGDLIVRGTLSAADRKLVRNGQSVEIRSEQLGTAVAGHITSIGPFTQGAQGTNGQGESTGDVQGSTVEPGHPIIVEGKKTLPEKFSGQDVVLTVQTASTKGKVLVVPASAIYATADGLTRVMMLGSDGARTPVTVTTGATGGGFVEIRTGDVREGDHVVVGDE